MVGQGVYWRYRDWSQINGHPSERHIENKNNRSRGLKNINGKVKVSLNFPN